MSICGYFKRMNGRWSRDPIRTAQPVRVESNTIYAFKRGGLEELFLAPDPPPTLWQRVKAWMTTP